MKRILKILVGIILLLLISVVTVVIWRGSNIWFAMQATQNSTDELEKKIEEHNAYIKDVLKNWPEANVRFPTEEEKKALRSRQLSEEELVEKLSSPSVTDGQEQSDFAKTLSAKVAKGVVLRERFENKIINLMKRAMQESEQLATSDSKFALASMAARYLMEAQDLESTCDEEMETLVSEIRALLKENGKDEALADTIMDLYHKEKELKKALFLSQLAESGLLDPELVDQQIPEVQPYQDEESQEIQDNQENQDDIVLPIIPFD